MKTFTFGEGRAWEVVGRAKEVGIVLQFNFRTMQMFNNYEIKVELNF